MDIKNHILCGCVKHNKIVTWHNILLLWNPLEIQSKNMNIYCETHWKYKARIWIFWSFHTFNGCSRYDVWVIVIKDVHLPDIKFILLGSNIISMDLGWFTFKTMVILVQCIHHLLRHSCFYPIDTHTFLLPCESIHFYRCEQSIIWAVWWCHSGLLVQCSRGLYSATLKHFTWS